MKKCRKFRLKRQKFRRLQEIFFGERHMRSSPGPHFCSVRHCLALFTLSYSTELGPHWTSISGHHFDTTKRSGISKCRCLTSGQLLYSRHLEFTIAILNELQHYLSYRGQECRSYPAVLRR